MILRSSHLFSFAANRASAIHGSSWLWRLVWLLMLAVHGKPLASFLAAFGSGQASPDFSFGRCAILALSATFFVLKIIDVRWLRFRQDFKGSVSWFVIVGLLHLGPISRAVQSDVPFFGAGLVCSLTGSLGLTLVLLSRLNRSAWARAVRDRLEISFDAVCLRQVCLSALLTTCAAGPRAPPSIQVA